jgi:hypothetical protein
MAGDDDDGQGMARRGAHLRSKIETKGHPEKAVSGILRRAVSLHPEKAVSGRPARAYSIGPDGREWPQAADRGAAGPARGTITAAIPCAGLE